MATSSYSSSGSISDVCVGVGNEVDDGLGYVLLDDGTRSLGLDDRPVVAVLEFGRLRCIGGTVRVGCRCSYYTDYNDQLV